MKQSKALNAITNLTLAQKGDRVSYATSISIADARAIFALAAKLVDQSFGRSHCNRNKPC